MIRKREAIISVNGIILLNMHNCTNKRFIFFFFYVMRIYSRISPSYKHSAKLSCFSNLGFHLYYIIRYYLRSSLHRLLSFLFPIFFFHIFLILRVKWIWIISYRLILFYNCFRPGNFYEIIIVDVIWKNEKKKTNTCIKLTKIKWRT